jgi:glycosyltransferase involved in cell wall biosynthesis
MRILHCLHNYHPARGGAENLMKDVSERLAARGHEVTVLAANSWSVEDFYEPGRGLDLMEPGESVINGVRVRREPFSRRLAPLLRKTAAAIRRAPVPGGSHLRSMSWGPRSRAYARAARQEAAAADLVVACPLPTRNVHYAWKAAARTGRPFAVVPCFHSEDPWTFDNPLHYRWMRRAAAVVCLTEAEKKHLESRAGLTPGKAHVAGAGIDIDSGPAPDPARARKKYGLPDGDIVLFAGQHGRHKNLTDLVKAMDLVWDAGCSAGLVIAGNPTVHTPEIEEQVASLPPEKRRRVVIIKGFPEEDKRELLRTAAVFVSVSAFESFGIVFLEAWREGLPVVGCTRGASSTLVEPGRDGLQVQPGRPRDLAGALLALLRDPDARRRMGGAGRRKIEDQYTWETIMDAWEKIYRDAVESRNAGGKRGARVDAAGAG